MYLFLLRFDVVLMVYKDVRSSLSIFQSPCRDNNVGADGSDSPVGPVRPFLGPHCPQTPTNKPHNHNTTKSPFLVIEDHCTSCPVPFTESAFM